MTDLNLAYGYSEQESHSQSLQPQQAQQAQQSPKQIYMPMEQKQEHIQSHAQPPEINYQPPENMFAQQSSVQNKNVRQQPSYSFWDRMNIKRPEVVKLAIFSLVIVLAISLDRISTYYINKYLDDNILSNIQEFLFRLSYPITVFIFLWIIKSM